VGISMVAEVFVSWQNAMMLKEIKQKDLWVNYFIPKVLYIN
jgi:hypothetical protein